MGGSSSKPPTTLSTLALDPTKGSYSGDYVQSALQKSIKYAEDLEKKNASWFSFGSLRTWGIILGVIVLLLGLMFIVIAIVDYFRCRMEYRPIVFSCDAMGNAANTGKPLWSSTAPPGSTGSTGPVSPPSSVSSARPIVQDWWYGPSSGNLISTMYDATTTTSVPSSHAPISAEGQGSYGVQWWMFVKDWNYNFGKEKAVLSRSDASNAGIMNPKVTLAPTENNLKVAVSIFPSSEGGGSKTEPAPAGHSSSSDDVFVCEVPNIPLQSWISVSVTVFDRNLDVYINGNLVKSCFLPGVPKPAVGNIDLAKDGGFSGYMCDLNHYGKALTPSDAQAFYNAGTSCANQTGSAGASGGYSLKFGVYNTKGKEVKEYTF